MDRWFHKPRSPVFLRFLYKVLYSFYLFHLRKKYETVISKFYTLPDSTQLLIGTHFAPSFTLIYPSLHIHPAKQVLYVQGGCLGCSQVGRQYSMQSDGTSFKGQDVGLVPILFKLAELESAKSKWGINNKTLIWKNMAADEHKIMNQLTSEMILNVLTLRFIYIPFLVLFSLH